MAVHFVRIAALCILSFVCMLLPFLPGDYDNMAVIVSSIVQLMGFVTLPLVLIGILWLMYAKKSYRFGIAALAVLSVGVLVASVAALGGIGSYRGSLALCFGLLIGYIYIVFSIIIPRLRRMKNRVEQKPSPIPYYLIIIPLVVVVFRSVCIVPAIEYSRERAIEQSATLIRDLETYYDKNGYYPVSMQGLWKDYYPDVAGIEKYYYEPNGDAYNLYFEQFTDNFTVREIVMYNKLDEHIIRSHPSFIFSLSPKQFERYRGYFAEYDLSNPHWKYYHFD